jgi:hypothetical protein
MVGEGGYDNVRTLTDSLQVLKRIWVRLRLGCFLYLRKVRSTTKFMETIIYYTLLYEEVGVW